MLILVNGFTEQCVTVSEKTNVFWRCLRRANKVVNFRLVGGGGGRGIHRVFLEREFWLSFRKIRVPYKSWLLNLLAR